jgi:hypothetical protein
MRRFRFDALTKYIEKHSDRVTHDLVTLFQTYQPYFASLLDTLKTVNETTANVPSISEKVELMSMEGEFAGLATRKSIHGPIIESFLDGKPQQYKHSHIGGILVGREGQIYVQIRSPNKSENPGKYDKLVGGHIPAGDSPLIATYHEFIEEMDVAVALCSQKNWTNILKKCPDATRHQAICKEPIPWYDFTSHRERIDGRTFDEKCDQYFVVGRYDGSFRFVDQEAAGVFQFDSRDQLKAEMDQDSTKFTDDLQKMVELFWEDLVPLDAALSTPQQSYQQRIGVKFSH